MIWSENEVLLQKLANESSTYAQLLRKIGLRDSGCNYLTLKRALLKFDIKFIVTDKRPVFKKMIMQEILVENSTYSNTKQLKRRLIKEGHFEHKCYKCNNTEWLGQKIPLQLEHKNGKRTDNRIENLTLLCPNCHSLTDTFCGKNKGSYKQLMRLKEEIYSNRKSKQKLQKKRQNQPKIKNEEIKKLKELQNQKQLMINKRIEDVKRTGQKWGYISELSNLWNISHTSVRRFLERHCQDLYFVS
jgi:IS1 family transposase